MAAVVCAWLRNDLRAHDSPVLQGAAALARQRGLPALPVYVLDPRHFQRTSHGTLKTGPFRALFLLQALRALKRRLRGLGSDLLVRIGRPEVVLPPLLPSGSVLLTQQEVTSEELGVDGRLRSALAGGVEWEYRWGSTLFHKEDLPFHDDLRNAPDVFTSFKNKVEPELAARVNEVPSSYEGKRKPQSSIRVRPCLPEPAKGSLPLPALDPAELGFEPSWADLPYEEAVAEPTPHEGAALDFCGGEDTALERLKYYLWDSDLLATYFDTRNGMLGGDYSTKLAPWLALGCISPRRVFEQVREYEGARVANKSTYWVIFELVWRDFFRFFAAKHGDAIFWRGGVAGRAEGWRRNDKLFDLWARGCTGFPLVDANMRELLATGFMSNRGRQNVASFLALDLGLDWRRGADWFESYLVDYDVTANWGNWVHAAGLTTGRVNRFNVVRQSKMYDPDGAYLRHWLPELRRVPAPRIHEPWLLQEAELQRYGAEAYPQPCLDPARFRETGGGGRRRR
uniref:Cryptochrome DASH n=1 Tax=Lingulaulax polyedra TaxID=160621 RepID=A0A516AG54_LINPO|nr:cryptochrome DASH [Lingulodinium polyedra]